MLQWSAAAILLPGVVMACGPDWPDSYYAQSNGEFKEGHFSISPDKLGELKLIGDFYFPAWRNRELMGNPIKTQEAHRMDFFATGKKLSRPKSEIKAAWKKYQDFAAACELSAELEEPFPAVPDDAGIYREFYLYTLGREQYCADPSDKFPPAWQELMKLPPASRHYRTVWVKFMQLLAEEEYGAIDKALAEFRQVLDSGFADTPALEESAVRQLCRRDEDLRFLPLALTALDPENPHYESICDDFSSYCRLYARKFFDISLLSLDPVGREILTVMDPGLLRKFPVLPDGKGAVLVADRQAWRAFFRGNFLLARQLLSLAPEKSLLRLYLEGKLARIDDQMEDAVQYFRDFLEEYRKRGAIPEGFCFEGAELPEQVCGELGMVQVSRRDFQEALLCFLQGKSWLDAAIVAERILSVPELKDFVKAHSDTPYQKELRELLARRLMRTYDVAGAGEYFAPENQEIHRRYIELSRSANNMEVPPQERALALYALSRLLWTHGMELFGTELEPDNKILDGSFPGSIIPDCWGDHFDWRMFEPEQEIRFHYRIRALGFAMRAAQLSPDTDCKVASLWLGWGIAAKYDELLQNSFYHALCDLRPHPAAEQAMQESWVPKVVKAAAAEWKKDAKSPDLAEIRAMVKELVEKSAPQKAEPDSAGEKEPKKEDAPAQ